MKITFQMKLQMILRLKQCLIKILLHPLVCYDGITGDLIKIQLRDGTQYSSTGVVDFLQPILDEYLEDFPEVKLLLRGDSGFATLSFINSVKKTVPAM